MRKLSGVALVAVLSVLTTAALAEDKPISGQVFDAAGQGVANVEVAVGWNCTDKSNRLEPAQKIRTDRTGRFSGVVPCGDKPVPVMALDKERKLGSLVIVKPANLGKVIKMTLAPLATVNGEIDLSDAGDVKTVKLDVLVKPDNVNLLSFEAKGAKVALSLPVGEYEIIASAPGCDSGMTEFEIDADENEVTIAALKPSLKMDMPADAGKKLPPALTVTDAKGVSKDVKLADYKGKWVVLEFWGFW
jgi:hypothetical protein